MLCRKNGDKPNLYMMCHCSRAALEGNVAVNMDVGMENERLCDANALLMQAVHPGHYTVGQNSIHHKILYLN